MNNIKVRRMMVGQEREEYEKKNVILHTFDDKFLFALSIRLFLAAILASTLHTKFTQEHRV